MDNELKEALDILLLVTAKESLVLHFTDKGDRKIFVADVHKARNTVQRFYDSMSGDNEPTELYINT